MSHPHVRQSGFTLLEVLMAVALLTMVFGVVATAFVVTVGSTRDTEEALLESQGHGFVYAVLIGDVGSATHLSLTEELCGAPGALVLASEWTDEAAVRVEYRLEAPTLVRYAWAGSCAATPRRTVLAAAVTAVDADALVEGDRTGVRLTLDGALLGREVEAFRRMK